MLKRSVLAAVISLAFACSTNAEASDGALTQYREPWDHRIEATQIAQSLFDEVVSWICENFDLPFTQNSTAHRVRQQKRTNAHSHRGPNRLARVRSRRNANLKRAQRRCCL